MTFQPARVPWGRTLGTPGSLGHARGPVLVVDGGQQREVRGGLDELVSAARRVAERLQAVAAAQAARAPEAAAILRAQAAIARDPALQQAIERRLKAGEGLAGALVDACDGFAHQIEGAGAEYLRARAADVREVGRLVAAELTGAGSELAMLAAPSVVVAHELAPADVLAADPDLVLALVVETAGVTSHLAIVARELGIPLIVAAPGALDAARRSAAAMVDGGTGEVAWMEVAVPAGAAPEGEHRPLPATPIPLTANAGSLAAVNAAARAGLAGVGLFRTEMLFMGRPEPPGEDEQLAQYVAICRAIAPHEVVVRTLDVGSDKNLRYLGQASEPNPALGRRGVRLWLQERSLSDPQSRALVRAAAASPNLSVMVPMVAAREEMEEVRRRFASAAADLGLTEPRLGMMVELPAAALGLAGFMGLVDFVSIGTNDLAQYALAADREGSWQDHLTELNPGVLRLIAEAIAGARRLGIRAGVCGELASRPEGAVFLCGAGAASLSVTTGAAVEVAEALAAAGLRQSRAAARAALAAPDTGTARDALLRALRPR